MPPTILPSSCKKKRKGIQVHFKQHFKWHTKPTNIYFLYIGDNPTTPKEILTLSVETNNREGIKKVLTSTCYHIKHFNTSIHDKKLLEEYM
jgi:hypothetical protein